VLIIVGADDECDVYDGSMGRTFAEIGLWDPDLVLWI